MPGGTYASKTPAQEINTSESFESQTLSDALAEFAWE
jgi:hypothetical protein